MFFKANVQVSSVNSQAQPNIKIARTETCDLSRLKSINRKGIISIQMVFVAIFSRQNVLWSCNFLWTITYVVRLSVCVGVNWSIKKDELYFMFPLHQLKYIIYVKTLYYYIGKTQKTYIVQKIWNKPMIADVIPMVFIEWHWYPTF